MWMGQCDVARSSARVRELAVCHYDVSSPNRPANYLSLLCGVQLVCATALPAAGAGLSANRTNHIVRAHTSHSRSGHKAGMRLVSSASASRRLCVCVCASACGFEPRYVQATFDTPIARRLRTLRSIRRSLFWALRHLFAPDMVSTRPSPRDFLRWFDRASVMAFVAARSQWKQQQQQGRRQQHQHQHQQQSQPRVNVQDSNPCVGGNIHNPMLQKQTLRQTSTVPR